MRRLNAISIAISITCALLVTTGAQAQFGRGVGDWSTSGSDAHRSSWVRTDPKISREGMLKLGFQFIWKVSLASDSKQPHLLSTPALFTGYIGYRGFRTFGFVAESSGMVYGIDTDLAKMEWQQRLPSAAPKPTQQPASSACVAGMTANVTRPVGLAFPQAPGRGGAGGGRGGPARSAVGEADEGAAILATLAAQARAAQAQAQAPGQPGRGGQLPGRGGQNVRTPLNIYALSSDGMLHAMYASNGHEPDPAIPFVPANANASALTVVDGFAYAVTSGGCGGVQNGVWALELASKQVSKWQATGDVAGSAGPAFGPDGTLYVTTQGQLVALDSKTLTPKDSYAVKGQSFTSSPVVFQYKEQVLIAAATNDGRIHVLDSANLGGSDHMTPLYSTAAGSASNFSPSALASWADTFGTRWLLAPSSNALVTWEVVEKDGAFALQSGWVSREMTAPLTPMVINGVAFTVSSGSSSVLYALDAMTGKELWNSGTTITAPVRPGTLVGGGSQLYLGTNDGTLYAFGYPIEH